MTTVADEVIKFVRSKVGTIVKHGPTNAGKCEELVYAALDHANADKGLAVTSAQKGDLITFANRSGKIVLKVTATSQGKKLFVQEDHASFSRGNHIAIVSQAPDTNGKILVLEQNVGTSKSVTESPLIILRGEGRTLGLPNGGSVNVPWTVPTSRQCGQAPGEIAYLATKKWLVISRCQ